MYCKIPNYNYIVLYILGQSRTQTPSSNNSSPVSLFNQTTVNNSPSKTNTLPSHKVSLIISEFNNCGHEK